MLALGIFAPEVLKEVFMDTVRFFGALALVNSLFFFAAMSRRKVAPQEFVCKEVPTVKLILFERHVAFLVRWLSFRLDLHPQLGRWIAGKEYAQELCEPDPGVRQY